MKLFYIRHILMMVFCKDNPLARISNIHQSERGWTAVLTDKINGQEYLMQIVPIESQVTVAPHSADQLLKMNLN